MNSIVHFAVYLPGQGFVLVPSITAGNHEVADALWKLYAGTRGSHWPEDMARMGVYACRGERWDLTDWEPLGLVHEVPGSRLERWSCGCGGTDRQCDTCGGSGFVDQYGEAWGAEDGVALSVRYAFDQVWIDRPPVGGNFYHGLRNAMIISGLIVLAGALAFALAMGSFPS